MKKKDLFISGLIDTEQLAYVLQETGAGLETIQLGIADNLDHLDETLRREREVLRELNPPRLTMHGPFLDLNPACFDRRIRSVTMDRFEQAYLAARELGAEKIVFHSGMIPSVYFTEGWAERMIDFWQEFLQDKSGIGICMENVLDEEIRPVEMVAEGVRHPDFGLCLDIGHAHCYARDSAGDWASQLAPWIRHVHLHDNDGKKDSHLALGRGSLPFREVISLLERDGRERTWTVECTSQGDILETVRQLSFDGE